jgi:ABC-2 type transport system ATP-binding protein
MRGDLAASLLHDPKILYLDEPTIGLDVVVKARIRDFLAELNRERGVTVLLTTHDISDIERLCSRVMIIDRGHLIYDGSLSAIKDRFGDERTLVVDLEKPAPPIDVPGAIVEKVDGPRQWLRFQRSETTAAELVAAVAARVRLRDLTIEEPEIEDIVRRIYVACPPVTPSHSSQCECSNALIMHILNGTVERVRDERVYNDGYRTGTGHSPGRGSSPARDQATQQADVPN